MARGVEALQQEARRRDVGLVRQLAQAAREGFRVVSGLLLKEQPGVKRAGLE
jgi:hypothetical protein